MHCVEPHCECPTTLPPAIIWKDVNRLEMNHSSQLSEKNYEFQRATQVGQ